MPDKLMSQKNAEFIGSLPVIANNAAMLRAASKVIHAKIAILEGYAKAIEAELDAREEND